MRMTDVRLLVFSLFAGSLFAQLIDLSRENPLFMQRSDGLYYAGQNHTKPVDAGKRRYNVSTPFGPGLLMITMPTQVADMESCTFWGGCMNPISKCTKMPERTACVPYHNSEIYDSNCCSPQIFNQLNTSSFVKEVMIDSCKGKWSNDINCELMQNPGIIDSNVTQYIQDLYFNVPFKPGRGVESWLKFEQIQIGSLGFGFWNTVMDKRMQMAWFLHQRGPGYPLNGLYIIIYKPGAFPVLKKLFDLDEEWHHYRVEWHETHIDFYFDHELVHRETQLLLRDPMALHIWHDNAIFNLLGSTVLHEPFAFNVTKLTTVANLTFLDLP